MGGDGDGWVSCAAGHRHWGRFGAAGLLISDGQRAVLQHRAPWTHEGDTWGLPGGARDSHEDPVTTALREASEEAAIGGEFVDPLALWVTDHGGWSYTTVLAMPRGPVVPRAANAESVDVRWWNLTEIADLPLHSGFSLSWPFVRTAPPQLTLVLAEAELPWADAASTLEPLARAGIPATALPSSITTGELDVLLPRIVLISARPRTAVALGWPQPQWWSRAVVYTPELGTLTQAGQVLRVSNGRGSDVSVHWLVAQVEALAETRL